MNNIVIGSKVKVRKPDNCERWEALSCPNRLAGIAIGEFEFTALEEDTKDFFVQNEAGAKFYFPKEAVYVVEAEHSPFAQDSLPIGTVVAWEGKKIEVAAWNIGGCKDCIFYPTSCGAKWCAASKNSDKVERKYILINEQQEEETMNIKLEDGKKYITEGGEVVTVNLVRDLASGYPYEGSNGFSYTINGRLYFGEDHSPNDIVREYVEAVRPEPEGHVHAELMLEYVKDALVSKEPWKGWQELIYHNDSSNTKEWVDCGYHPSWEDEEEYRRKPKTININGYEVPEPIRDLPDLGKPGVSETVWIPSLSEYPSFALGVGNSYTRVFFDKGLCHLTKEAADLHAKALLSFTTAVQE